MLTYTLLRTVSSYCGVLIKLSLLSTHPFGVNTPKLKIITFGLKKLETFLYRTVERYFNTLNRVGVAHECDRRTDRQPEPSLAIARSNSDRRAIKADSPSNLQPET